MPIFTHIVLTAPTCAIAEVYQYQLNLIKYNHNFIYFSTKCNINCISDPLSYRVGSGGGTLNALSYLRTKYPDFNDTNNKILIIHSGGDSQRAPLYSLCGKAWMSINAYINESSPEIIASPLMLLIEELTMFCRSVPNRSLVIASSDVMLHFSNQLSSSQSMKQHIVLNINNDAVTVVALPESIHIAKNHGVLISSLTSTIINDDEDVSERYDSMFVSEDIKREPVIEYLQKPSIHEMHAKHAILSASYTSKISRNNENRLSDQQIQISSSSSSSKLSSNKLKYIPNNDNNSNELTLVDTGVVIFTGKAYLNLLSLLDNPIISDYCTFQGIKTAIDTFKKVKPLRIELYSDILHAMQLHNQQDYSLQLYMKRLGIEDQIEDNNHSSQETNIYIQALPVLWSTFKYTPLELLFVPNGRFEHLGTTKEALNMLNMAHSYNSSDHSTLALFAKKYQLKASISSNFLNEYSKEVFHGISINSFFHNQQHSNNNLVNDLSIVAPVSEAIEVITDQQSRFVVEHSLLEGNYYLPTNGMLSHVSGCIGRDLVVIDKIMIQQIILKASDITRSFDIDSSSTVVRGMFILLIIGMNDDIKNSFMKSTISSSTWNHFFLITGLQPSDIWKDGDDQHNNDSRTLWNAKIFPIFQVNEVDNNNNNNNNIHVLMKQSKEWLACNKLTLTWLQDLVSLIIDTNQNISNTKINMPKEHQEEEEEEEGCNKYNSAIHMWKDVIKISLADILVYGDALSMLKYREWLQINHCRNSNKYIKLTNITNIYRYLSYINHIDLNKHICLSLWMILLCDSPTYIHDKTICIQSSRCLQDYLIMICRLDQNQVTQTLLDFNILFEMINSANDFNLNILFIDYLKNDIQYKDDFILVIESLYSCIPNISIEFHSRVLFLSAWLLKHKSIYLDVILLQKIKYIDHLFIEIFDFIRGSSNKNNNNFILLKCQQYSLQILENIKDFLIISLNSNNIINKDDDIIDHINNLECIELSIVLETYAQKFIALHIQQSLYHHLVRTSKSSSSTKITSTTTTSTIPTTITTVPSTLITTTTIPSLLVNKITLPQSSDNTLVNYNKVIVTHSPVRIDLAGGWSDTPPICYEQSGSVLNVAVAIDQKYPIRCACRLISKPMIALHSTMKKAHAHDGIITNSSSSCTTSSSFDYYTESIDCKNYFDFDCIAKNVNSEEQPCLLLKAVIVALSIIDFSKPIIDEYQLSDQLLYRYQGGFEIHCVSDLPPGSGMGGSSVLAATILHSLSELFNIQQYQQQYQIDKNILVYLVSLVEQLLTTGGGWQDQVGCIYPGFKIGRSPQKLPLTVNVDVINTNIEFNLRLQQRMFLIYTGQQRLAKNTLINALRCNAIIPVIIISADPIKYNATGIVTQLIQDAEDCYHMLLTMNNNNNNTTNTNKNNNNTYNNNNNNSNNNNNNNNNNTNNNIKEEEERFLSIDDYIDKLAMYINNYWKLKKHMAKGSEPEYIQVLFHKLEAYCIGCSLCGAGGGGYAVVILHSSYNVIDIQNVINEINNENRMKYITYNNTSNSSSISNIINNVTSGSSSNEMEEQLLSIHHIDIDLHGIHSYTCIVNDDDKISSLERFLI